MIHKMSGNFIPNNVMQSCYCKSPFPVMKDKNILEFTISNIRAVITSQDGQLIDLELTPMLN